MSAPLTEQDQFNIWRQLPLNSEQRAQLLQILAESKQQADEQPVTITLSHNDFSDSEVLISPTPPPQLSESKTLSPENKEDDLSEPIAQ